jgi:GntR family transcriptional regulator, transcriptional repressor for pyruvate dehydrogenase complex
MAAVSGQAFRVVHKTRASEGIVEQVHDLITAGQLKVGDRLPSERDLAQQLQVGRSTVREAIRAMESLGMLQVRSGEGTFLSANPHDLRPDVANHNFFRAWDNQHKLFEVRKVIEPDLAALAARRATTSHLQQMHETLEEQDGLIKAGRNIIKADTTFHFLIAEAAGNDILFRLMDGLMDVLEETREAALNASGRPARSLKQHRAVLRAIETRNATLAAQRMEEHIEEMEQLSFASQRWSGAAPASLPRRPVRKAKGASE